jgi:hypothetical protein
MNKPANRSIVILANRTVGGWYGSQADRTLHEALPIREPLSAKDTVLGIPVRPKLSAKHHKSEDFTLIPTKTRGH